MNSRQTPPEPAAAMAFGARLRSGARRHSMACFLGALFLLFATSPFFQVFQQGTVLEAVLSTLVLITAVLAVGAGRKGFATAVALAAPTLVARWALEMRDGNAIFAVLAVTYFVFVAYVVFQLLRFILRARQVNSEVLCAAVGNYLLLILLWATTYTLLQRLTPGSFSGPLPGRGLGGSDALYFSVITMTTVGYGDFAPVSPSARMLAAIQAITGTLYMAVLIARLVAVYTTADRRK